LSFLLLAETARETPKQQHRPLPLPLHCCPFTVHSCHCCLCCRCCLCAAALATSALHCPTPPQHYPTLHCTSTTTTTPQHRILLPPWLVPRQRLLLLLQMQTLRMPPLPPALISLS